MSSNKREEEPVKDTIETNDVDDVFAEYAPKQQEPLPENEVKKLFYTIRSNDKYPMEQTKTRNVLIVGKTRSGKTTATNVLKGMANFHFFFPKNHFFLLLLKTKILFF